jgi:hypothetical protein
MCIFRRFVATGAISEAFACGYYHAYQDGLTWSCFKSECASSCYNLNKWQSLFHFTYKVE